MVDETLLLLMHREPSLSDGSHCSCPLLSPAVPSCQLSSACGRYLLHANHTEHLGLENLHSKPTLAPGGFIPPLQEFISQFCKSQGGFY